MSEKKSGSTKTVIRVVVFGALAVVLVLAVLDFQAKNAKIASYEKVSEALKESETLLFSDVEEMLEGSPSLDGDPKSDNEVTYTWKVLRTYQIKLYVSSNGENRVVDTVDPMDGS